jgi:hypothetical protein
MNASFHIQFNYIFSSYMDVRRYVREVNFGVVKQASKLRFWEFRSFLCDFWSSVQ